MTLAKVFLHIETLYLQGLKMKNIRKPMAWAVYHTWKWIDKQEAERGGIEEARDKDKLCEYPYNRCIDILRRAGE